jgi:hypothetical protein
VGPAARPPPVSGIVGERLTTGGSRASPLIANQDEAIIEHQEALHVQQVGDLFFARLMELVQTLQHELGAA